MEKLSFGKTAQIGIRLLFRGSYTLSFDQLEFHLHKLRFRKRINLFIQAAQIMMRLVHRFGFPPILQIEPTNICNLHCLTCATGAGMMKRPPRLMPYEMFCNVIDQVKDHVYLLVFWSWGEPFIHKDAYRMIRYAKDQGLLVHTSTNGHFFDTRESAKQAVDSGLDSLIIAVDGLDQSVYERYRKGGNLNLVIKSIENLVAERIAAGVNHPRITFRFIVMKHNEHQVDKVKDFAKSLGADAVTFRSAVVQRSGFDLDETLAPLSEEFQQYHYRGSPKKEHRIIQKDYYCHRPYANLTIFSNGEVVACENDYNATVTFGNVRNQSLQEIFSSPRVKNFFRAFRYDLDQFSFCHSCEIRDFKHHTANVQTHILNKDFKHHEKDS